MAQLKSSSQTRIDGKASIDANNEVAELPAGAAAEVAAGRTNSVKRADGTWTPVGDNPLTWYTPTFVNSWADFTGAWAARYAKDLTNGIVYMKGLVKGGSNTIDSTIFTLPVGMRPSTTITLSQTDLGGAGRFDIESTGVVKFVGSIVHTGDANAWLSITATFKGEL